MWGDTIAAIATPLGTGGIGIVRLSGPEALFILKKIFRPARPREDFPSYRVFYGHVVDPATEKVVDEVIVTVMQAPRSYTREDVVEINGHGGIVPLRKILELALRAGARLASPGEFTRRAFLNGRIDLAQAEAVLDLVAARTGEGLAAALAQASGQLSGKIRRLREEVLALVAAIEASIDFTDEVPEPEQKEIKAKVSTWQEEVKGLLAAAEKGRIFREGVTAVIAGKPNVGKSSLLNALCREERALVTELPGTTRDVITEFLDLGGVPLKILDTAGIQRTNNYVEQLGIERAWENIRRADLILLILDGTRDLEEEERELLAFLREREGIVLINKIDVAPPEKVEALARAAGGESLKISALWGTGLEELTAKIRAKFLGGEIRPGEDVFLLHLRQKEVLLRVASSLEEVQRGVEEGLPGDFLVIGLREILMVLGEITGETVTEEVLEKIFADFCVGK